MNSELSNDTMESSVDILARDSSARISPKIWQNYRHFVSTLVTALLHTLEPFKLAHSFLMGVIFASFVVWTGSVYTSIILHSIHNSLALIP